MNAITTTAGTFTFVKPGLVTLTHHTPEMSREFEYSLQRRDPAWPGDDDHIVLAPYILETQGGGHNIYADRPIGRIRGDSPSAVLKFFASRYTP